MSGSGLVIAVIGLVYLTGLGILMYKVTALGRRLKQEEKRYDHLSRAIDQQLQELWKKQDGSSSDL